MQKSKELAAHMLKSKVYTAFGHVTSLSIKYAHTAFYKLEKTKACDLGHVTGFKKT